MGRFSVVSITALALLTAGCGTAKRSKEGAANRPSLPSAKAPSGPLPPPDRSLSIREYRSAGVPPHEKAWSGQDLVMATRSLIAIAQQSPAELPRYRSDKSGEVFKRMTSRENLVSLNKSSVSIDKRLGEALQFLDASNRLLKLYLAAFNNRRVVGGAELVELSGNMLRVTVTMLKLVEEFRPTLDKNAPDYADRVAGFNQMKFGVGFIVDGSLMTLAESHAYQSADLKRMAGYMTKTFPEILPILTEERRSQAMEKIRNYLSDPRMEYLKPELEALAAASRKAVAGK